jgi:hypothetical protein
VVVNFRDVVAGLVVADVVVFLWVVVMELAGLVVTVTVTVEVVDVFAVVEPPLPVVVLVATERVEVFVVLRFVEPLSVTVTVTVTTGGFAHVSVDPPLVVVGFEEDVKAFLFSNGAGRPFTIAKDPTKRPSIFPK